MGYAVAGRSRRLSATFRRTPCGVGGGYGSTDASAVALPCFDRPGAGRVLDNHDVGIDNAHDDLLAPGQTGELVVCPRETSIMSSGYFGDPHATLASWRNLWFHTGDLARLDADGYLHFAGRMSERIRVRGEMVSAHEVEEVLITHPAVEDCAVIPVPGAAGEDDVKAFVTLRAGQTLDADCLPHAHEPLHGTAPRGVPVRDAAHAERQASEGGIAARVSRAPDHSPSQ